MHRLVLSCLASLTLVTGQTPNAGAFDFSHLQHDRASETHETRQLINPTATTCLDAVEGCSLISLERNSIQLLNPELSVGIDGSLTIEATASWINSRSMEAQQSKIVIRLPKQLRPLTIPTSKAISSQTRETNKMVSCNKPEAANGNTLSLNQLSEILMGQQPISRSAALFTSNCNR